MQQTSIKEEGTLSQPLCRICAREQQIDSPMNNLLTSDHNGLYFVDILHDCLQRAIPCDNGFPLHICLDCTSTMFVVYNFRLMFEASEKKLTEMLGYGCKSEELERKVDVIVDELENDVKPSYFIDCAAFDLPVRDDAELKFAKQTKVKVNELRAQLYECYQCKSIFKRIALLRKHMKNHHDIAKCWSCSDCHKRYSCRKKLVDHFHKHISKECEHCSESISALRDMQKHYEHVHTERLVSHQCYRCVKTFVLPAQLRIHMLDHLNKHEGRHSNRNSNSTSEEPHSNFLCSECGKTFKNKWLLISHQNVHSTEKQFVCPKCPSRFKWKLALNYHLTIHQSEDRQKHVCETCGAAFTTRSSMKAHTKIHSGIRPYACDKCSQRFLRRDHLTRHYLSHTGEKPYVCKYCDRSFRQCAQLNTHLRVHVGENTYQCDLCLCKFKLKAEMKQHECEYYENKEIT